MTPSDTQAISPFFIFRNVDQTIASNAISLLLKQIAGAQGRLAAAEPQAPSFLGSESFFRYP